MEIQIERLRQEHAPYIQQLSEQLGYSLASEQIERNIREVTSNRDHVAFVAIAEGKVVAWIHAFRAIFLESRSFIEIGGLVVEEAYRNKSIGKKLVESVKQWCIEMNLSVLRVRSQVKRKAAHQFYASAGFEEIKEQKVFQMNL